MRACVFVCACVRACVSVRVCVRAWKRVCEEGKKRAVRGLGCFSLEYAQLPASTNSISVI